MEKYDSELKKQVPVVFNHGDRISFECVHGFTLDGSNDGDREFEVECNEQGYYKPDGVCIEASKCGSIPSIPYALPTGRKVGHAVQMTCQQGYSLDGEKVVPGGLAKNQVFEIKCIEFSGEYEKFEGKCRPSGHVPATEMVRMYTDVFEALFVASCKGTLAHEFRAGNSPGVDDSCGKIGDEELAGKCDSLVSKIEADFEEKAAAREDYDEAVREAEEAAEKAEKESGEEKKKLMKEAEAASPVGKRPGIHEEATEFCSKLWKVLELQPPKK